MPRQLLRPDAALCLLALYDWLITRPYGQQELRLNLPVPDIGRNEDQLRAANSELSEWWL
jgi:hypothetical protein